MSVWSRVGDWLAGGRFAQRAMDVSAFAIGDPMWSGKTDAGVTVDRETAKQLVAVYACQGLISDSVSTMPVDLFRKTSTGRETVDRQPRWIEFPNEDQSWQAFIEQLVMDLLNPGNTFVEITLGDLFRPDSLRVVPADEFIVTREDGRKRLFHMPSGQYKSLYSALRPDGQILHISGLSDNGLFGLSPIEKAQQAIGLGLATEKFGAKFFGNGSQLAGYVTMPQGSQPTEDQMKAFGEMWRRKYASVDKAWSVPVLANGATWNPVALPNDQAQFIESRKFSVAEIARLYRVPPHMIGDVERSTSWGSGIEEQGIGFVTYTLNTWIKRLEVALSQLTPRGQYLKWNVNALLRGDIQSRYAAYQTGISTGFISRNEAREWEDLPAEQGLDEFLIPVNQAQPQGAATP